jgi:uncharacterized protein YbjT (DUF2867 family)
MADTTVLVTGATGTVSTALRASLRGKPGIKVRALVHDRRRERPSRRKDTRSPSAIWRSLTRWRTPSTGSTSSGS